MEARAVNKNFAWVIGGGVLVVLGVALYAMWSNQPTGTAEKSTATAALETTASSPSALEEVSFDVEGMTCESCKISVEQALLKVPGVQSASADVNLHKATVQYDPKAVPDLDALKAQCRKAIEKVGYRVKA